jgi:hypothetical protein
MVPRLGKKMFGYVIPTEEQQRNMAVRHTIYGRPPAKSTDRWPVGQAYLDNVGDGYGGSRSLAKESPTREAAHSGSHVSKTLRGESPTSRSSRNQSPTTSREAQIRRTKAVGKLN